MQHAQHVRWRIFGAVRVRAERQAMPGFPATSQRTPASRLSPVGKFRCPLFSCGCIEHTRRVARRCMCRHRRRSLAISSYLQRLHPLVRTMQAPTGFRALPWHVDRSTGSRACCEWRRAEDSVLLLGSQSSIVLAWITHTQYSSMHATSDAF